MGEKEWSPVNILDIFGDSLSREIIVIASKHPVSVDDLAEQFEASRPTIYRRINTLMDYDLLKEHVEIDTDGNHYKTFETTLKHISFEIEDGGYNIDIQLRQGLVDQFEAFWSDLEQSRPTTDPRESGHSQSEGDPHHG